MKRIALLENPVQEYAWGSRTFIQGLLGKKSPSQRPMAELWMGAHPKAPSFVLLDGGKRSLLELILESPAEILGKGVKESSPTLPFLFKVLAASKPLSIQAHPNRAQALEGFKRENRLTIPIHDPRRNYRDPNHKPEIICALEPFWAMKGFRPLGQVVDVMTRMDLPSLKGPVRALRRNQSPEGFKHFFKTLMSMDGAAQRRVLEEALACSRENRHGDPAFEWVVKLHREHPADIGVLSPLMLNMVRLEPGQAMFIEAGVLHCYLKGSGIELMANSDNVLRGGLTPKHVDHEELLRILDFSDRQVDVIRPAGLGNLEQYYPVPTREFLLSAIHLEEGDSYTSPKDRSVEILICMEGKGNVTDLGSGQQIGISRGISFIVPASVAQYRISGKATLYKASAPLLRELV
ncbi:MAG: mannose-6-phosphate isomerase, class I [Deltaproteobacteria bacterium]|nr:mannose-6-phosphate isomerase, class I [Deltaproteobacteria bacterium]MBW2138272.1 mannose-6-phosphate isomerase, class I [Deltaproteobacteria bacterium]